MFHSVSREIGGKTLNLETGKLAVQADGAVTVRYGDTIILVTACMSAQLRPDVDFLPLTVDYEERLYAVGKIPGSFFRREGRPSQEAILVDRLTDRTIRPLFPKDLRNEIQVITTVLSADRENSPDVLSIIGASAALAISGIPFQGAVSATRMGLADGQHIINPTFPQLEESSLNLVVSGTRDAVVMVEAGANELPEEAVLEALRIGQETNQQAIDLIEELVQAVGKPKMPFTPETADEEVKSKVEELIGDKLSQLLEEGGLKMEREANVAALETEAKEQLAESYPGEQVAGAFESLLKKRVRSRILEKGIRPSGRGTGDVREISSEVGVLPRTHGSGLFNRGLTQVLTIATLASIGMEKKLDTLSPEESKRFFHDYNFLPFSTGETKRIGSPGRREIGHGALAERAILSVLPSKEDFPYTIRLVSEVLSSNGSTSMASACGSTLALMDAGVPIKAPVAGVAMGLVMGDNGRYAVLTDIEGIEDQLGDMDFKVAGTAKGINALQMDVKITGLTLEVLRDALQQAREARLYILEEMLKAIEKPRESLSPYAPKLIRIKIPVDKIGAVIGSGGRTIRSIQEETGATIDIEDDGSVVLGSVDDAAIQKAKQRIEDLTREVKVGDIFTGKITRLANFGAFVEITPGKDGLVRSGELGDMEDGVRVGQEVTVMVTEIDSMGRINLSRRALMGGSDSPGDRPVRPGPEPRYRPTGGGPGNSPNRGPSFRDGDRRRFDRGPRSGSGPGSPPRQGPPPGYGDSGQGQ